MPEYTLMNWLKDLQVHAAPLLLRTTQGRVGPLQLRRGWTSLDSSTPRTRASLNARDMAALPSIRVSAVHVTLIVAVPWSQLRQATAFHIRKVADE